eukprot:2494010-Karenia_brevis.AAC.1
MGVQARNSRAIKNRTDLRSISGVDRAVYHKAINKVKDIKHQQIVRHVSSLGAITEGTYHKHDSSTVARCPYCSDADASFLHS